MRQAPMACLCVLILSAMPVRHGQAQSFDLTLILLLTGPVSEAVQETVLLIRRGDNFISLDSLAVACAGGGSAGAMVAYLPMLGITPTGIAVAPAFGYVVGATALGCSMAMLAGLVGMTTQRALNLW